MPNEGTNSAVPFKTTTPDLGAYFREGWTLYKESFVLLLMTSLVFWALSIISLSILMGPLIAGYMFLFIRTLRGEQVRVGNLFDGFRRFIPILLAFYLTNMLIAIGMFLLIIPGLIFIAYFLFVEVLILDKNLGVFEAMKLNKEMASRRGLWNFVGLNIALVLLLNLPGILSVGIGYLLILPYVMSVYAVAYEDCFGEVEVIQLDSSEGD